MHFISDEESNICKFLHRKTSIKKSLFYKLIRQRKILINEIFASANSKVRENDKVCVDYELQIDKQEIKSKQLCAMIDKFIIYEDRNLIVVNKKSGWCSQGGYHIDASMHTALLALADSRGEQYFPLHRLDRLTSGIMLFAKNLKTTKEVGKLFLDRKIRKLYICELQKHIVSQRVEVNLDNQYSHSNFICIRDNFYIVEIFTGRKHQIRKHAQSLCAPIVGDEIYSDDRKNRFKLHSFAALIHDKWIFASLPQHWTISFGEIHNYFQRIVNKI